MKSLFLLIAFCLGTQTLYAQAKSVVGQFGEIRVKQLVTPGFEDLTSDRKLYFYYLAQAMKVSDEIFWRQYSRHGVAIRDLLLRLLDFEPLYAQIQEVELAGFKAKQDKMYWLNEDMIKARFPIEAIKYYLFEISIFRGNYDYMKNSKILPEDLSSLDLFRLIRYAQKSKALSKSEAEKLRLEVRRLRHAIFNPNYFPKYKNSKNGDRLLGSPSAFYGPGVRQAEASKAPTSILTYLSRDNNDQVIVEKHTMNSGPHKEYLALIDDYLEKASQYANETEKDLIRLHRKVLRSGDIEDYKAYEVAWVQYNSEDIDYRLDYVEPYLDPIGFRAYHEGMLTLKKIDAETIRQQSAISNIIYDLEEKMPVEDRFKKTGDFIIPSAETVNLAFSAGAAGAKPMGGYNLSNFKEVEDLVGSKSHSLSNVSMNIGSTKSPEEEKRSVSIYISAEHAKDVKQFSLEKTYPLHVNFHEVAGHGSGKILEGNPREDLGPLYNPMEELRAETAAVYHVLDVDFLYENKIFPPDMSLEQARSFSRASVVNFFTKQLTYWRTIHDKDAIKQAHRMANQVQLNYMIEKGIIEISLNQISESFDENGKEVTKEFEIPVVQIKDFTKLREALAEIWAIVQKNISLSEKAEADDFLSRWSYYNKEQRFFANKLKLYAEATNQPTKTHFLRPEVRLTKDAKSVELIYHDGKNGMEQGIEIVRSYRDFTEAGLQKRSRACSSSAGKK